MNETAETITFRRRTYTVERTIPVTPLLAAEGLTNQQIIIGEKGATYLLQSYTDGSRKAITTSGRVTWEYPAA